MGSRPKLDAAEGDSRPGTERQVLATVGLLELITRETTPSEVLRHCVLGRGLL
jgi:hypothetical protein